jgi:ADP-ribose pyrophosphatase YjhB (NUDIX family)
MSVKLAGLKQNFAMIHYCPQCGNPVNARVPAGDNRLRAICDACGHIHYENPKLVLGCVAEWQGRVLLCRRAIEPRAGFWTLPAGFMENGESTQAAATRETEEEARAQVNIDNLFALIDIPQISQVHLFYRGVLENGQHAPGEESLETALFPEAEIPWDTLAFRSVRFCLEYYFDDRRRGIFGVHRHTLPSLPYAKT